MALDREMDRPRDLRGVRRRAFTYRLIWRATCESVGLIALKLTLLGLFAPIAAAQADLGAILSGEEAPEQFDFASVRFSNRGLERLDAIAQSANAAFLPQGIGVTGFTPTDVDCRWIAIVEGVEAARLAHSALAYAESRARAERLVGERMARAERAARQAVEGGSGPAAALLAESARDSAWTALW